MAAFVAFELWVPVLAIVVRALAGSTVPAAVQALASLLGLAVPTVVALALSDYLADRPGLVKPYQPKRRPGTDSGGKGPQGPGEVESDPAGGGGGAPEGPQGGPGEVESDPAGGGGGAPEGPQGGAGEDPEERS